MQDPLFTPGMAWKDALSVILQNIDWQRSSKAVNKGRYPHTPTRVYKYIPVLPEELEGSTDGLRLNAMKPLVNGKLVIGCLEALKMFFRAKFSTPPGMNM